MNSDEKRPLGSPGFVNRRGHNADISTQDLDGLSIDDQPKVDLADQTTPKTAKKSGKAPKKSKKPKTRRHAKWTRRHTIILIAVIVVIIAIPVVVGEILRAQYAASSEAAKASLKTVVASDVLPLQKKSEVTSKQVSGVTDKLESIRDNMCPGGLLDNMATLYPRARAAHQECIDERGKIAGLVTQLRDMVSMLAHIESLNAALAPVSGQATDAFAVIATQQSSWQQVSESLQKLKAPATLKTANDQLITAVKSITDGWSKLNIANNAQNAADFQAAEKQLSDGYGTVRASKDAFATAIATKQATISKLAEQLD
ncbi:hypothetical protein EYC58_05150 [Candidatus Saccharibacteria bacterium]|nr:MAG: hypothetical protein EYC58_05150 [Candidatus Saccharibacteria bacterium]